MDNGKRCYLCKYALAVVEHKEDKERKFYIRCKIDNADYEPCGACMLYEEVKRRKKECL